MKQKLLLESIIPTVGVIAGRVAGEVIVRLLKYMVNNLAEKDIIEAVKSSGYLMEQEIATAFEGLGYNVVTNRAYTDLHESRSREIDVSVIKRLYDNRELNLSFFVEFICECKNNDNPFVFITRDKNPFDNQIQKKEFVFPFPTYNEIISQSTDSVSMREISLFHHLGLDKVHYYYMGNQKAVQFCKIVKDKNSWKANHDGIYDSIFLPLIKAMLARKEEIKRIRSIWLFFPIVITSGELFVINSMNNNPEAVKVDYVTFKREMKEEKIDGHFFIDFIQKNYLTEFVKNRVEPIMDSLLKICENNPNIFLNNTLK